MKNPGGPFPHSFRPSTASKRGEGNADLRCLTAALEIGAPGGALHMRRLSRCFSEWNDVWGRKIVKERMDWAQRRRACIVRPWTCD